MSQAGLAKGVWKDPLDLWAPKVKEESKVTLAHLELASEERWVPLEYQVNLGNPAMLKMDSQEALALKERQDQLDILVPQALPALPASVTPPSVHTSPVLLPGQVM